MAKSKKLIKIVLPIILATVFGIAAVFIGCTKNEPLPEGMMYVDFIDVGQGDCTLISTTDAVILIDAGEAENVNNVIDFLKHREIKKIDYCIATHPHSDHIGGLPTVFDHFEVDTVIMPEIPEEIEPTTKVYEKFIDGLEKVENVIYATPGDKFECGSLNIEILGPTGEYDDLNNYSVVSKITFGETSVIVTGDAENPAEKDMLDVKNVDYSADILKLGHHGSSTSSSKDWLRAVNPKYAVISCGIDNKYNHPHKETIIKLDDLKFEYYRTDLVGNICFESDGKNITYRKK